MAGGTTIKTTPGGTFGTIVKVDPIRLADFLRSPSGPIMRRFFNDAELVKQEARRLVGVSQPSPMGGGRKNRRPGTLRDSIVKRFADVGGDINIIVGSNDPIALLHHEGTQPHPIDPVNGEWLVFYSAKAGKIVFTKHVNHPGTKPNRYLTNALRVLIGRY